MNIHFFFKHDQLPPPLLLRCHYHLVIVINHHQQQQQHCDIQKMDHKNNITIKALYSPVSDGPSRVFYTAPPRNEPFDPSRVYALPEPLTVSFKSLAASVSSLSLSLTPSQEVLTHQTLTMCGKSFRDPNTIRYNPRDFNENFQRLLEDSFNETWDGGEGEGEEEDDKDDHHHHPKLIPSSTDLLLDEITPHLHHHPLLKIPRNLDLNMSHDDARRLNTSWMVLCGPQGSAITGLPLLVVFPEPIDLSLSSSSSSSSLLVGALSSPFSRTTDDAVSIEVTRAANTILSAMALVVQGCFHNIAILEGHSLSPTFNANQTKSLLTHLRVPDHFTLLAAANIGSSDLITLESKKLETADYPRMAGSRGRDVTALRIKSSVFVTQHEDSDMKSLMDQVLADGDLVEIKMLTRFLDLTTRQLSVIKSRLNEALKLSSGTDFDAVRKKMGQCLAKPSNAPPITSVIKQLYIACGTVPTDLFLYSLELATSGWYTFSELLDYMIPLCSEFPELSDYIQFFGALNEVALGPTQVTGQVRSGLVHLLPMKREQAARQLITTALPGMKDRLKFIGLCRYLIPESASVRLRKNTSGLFSKINQLATDVKDTVSHSLAGSDTQTSKYLTEKLIIYLSGVEEQNGGKALPPQTVLPAPAVVAPAAESSTPPRSHQQQQQQPPPSNRVTVPVPISTPVALPTRVAVPVTRLATTPISTPTNPMPVNVAAAVAPHPVPQRNYNPFEEAAAQEDAETQRVIDAINTLPSVPQTTSEEIADHIRNKQKLLPATVSSLLLVGRDGAKAKNKKKVETTTRWFKKQPVNDLVHWRTFAGQRWLQQQQQKEEDGGVNRAVMGKLARNPYPMKVFRGDEPTLRHLAITTTLPEPLTNRELQRVMMETINPKAPLLDKLRQGVGVSIPSLHVRLQAGWAWNESGFYMTSVNGGGGLMCLKKVESGGGDETDTTTTTASSNKVSRFDLTFLLGVHEYSGRGDGGGMGHGDLLTERLAVKIPQPLTLEHLTTLFSKSKIRHVGLLNSREQIYIASYLPEDKKLNVTILAIKPMQRGSVGGGGSSDIYVVDSIQSHQAHVSRDIDLATTHLGDVLDIVINTNDGEIGGGSGGVGGQDEMNSVTVTAVFSGGRFMSMVHDVNKQSGVKRLELVAKNHIHIPPHAYSTLSYAKFIPGSPRVICYWHVADTNKEVKAWVTVHHLAHPDMPEGSCELKTVSTTVVVPAPLDLPMVPTQLGNLFDSPFFRFSAVAAASAKVVATSTSSSSSSLSHTILFGRWMVEKTLSHGSCYLQDAANQFSPIGELLLSGSISSPTSPLCFYYSSIHDALWIVTKQGILIPLLSSSSSSE